MLKTFIQKKKSSYLHEIQIYLDVLLVYLVTLNPWRMPVERFIFVL